MNPDPYVLAYACGCPFAVTAADSREEAWSKIYPDGGDDEARSYGVLLRQYSNADWQTSIMPRLGECQHRELEA